jgi:hypothetical protein
VGGAVSSGGAVLDHIDLEGEDVAEPMDDDTGDEVEEIEADDQGNQAAHRQELTQDPKRYVDCSFRDLCDVALRIFLALPLVFAVFSPWVIRSRGSSAETSLVRYGWLARPYPFRYFRTCCCALF